MILSNEDKENDQDVDVVHHRATYGEFQPKTFPSVREGDYQDHYMPTDSTFVYIIKTLQSDTTTQKFPTIA